MSIDGVVGGHLAVLALIDMSSTLSQTRRSQLVAAAVCALRRDTSIFSVFH